MIRKIKSWFIRRQKNKPLNWLRRWDAACQRLWDKFLYLPVSENNLQWMERNHTRLMNLVFKKQF